jgi:Zn-dependent metalloprotease
MKPMLASALALGCVSAALVASAGVSQATPTSHDRKADSIDAARANAREHAGVGAGLGLVVRDTVLDDSGASHVRFTRTFRGLEVVGGDLVVHQGRSGDFRSVSGRTLAHGIHMESEATVSGRKAADKAAATVDFAKSTAHPELVVLAAGRAPVLAWRVDVTGRHADGSPAGEYVFVGARKGAVLDHWPSVLEDTGSGTGLYSGTVSLDTTLSGSTYQMVDPVRGGNATYNGPYSSNPPIYTDADNVWGTGSNTNAQTAGVDAHYGIAKTWDYYKSTFARNGIANDGKGARSYVHDGAYVNASWSDACFCMKYGDGDGTTYGPLVELDIAGHEMSHGVTSRTANLTYRGESGGLNEANSDIMGTNVEFYANNANDVPDYVIGEEIFLSYNPATNFIRRMDKPSLDGASQNCYTTRTKSVDVHYSSGVANHFFYLLSEGSGVKTINGIAYNSPTCNGSTITGIGRTAAAAIWYRALTVYMTSNTNYAAARVATVNAATDLYGATSAQVATVKTAWSAVSVN